MKLSPAMTAKILAMAAGDPPKAKPVKVCAAKPATVRWSFTLSVPVSVVSEANRRDHWATKLRRARQQEEAMAFALSSSPVRLAFATFPLSVTFVRIGRMGPHQEQDDDNLRSAFKVLRDYIASCLNVDDGDSRVTWKYDQRAGKPGVEVRIEFGMEASCP